MAQVDFEDSLFGLYAYDTGCVSSGIHDELLRDHVIKVIQEMSEEEFRLFISRLVREHFLSEEALSQGYGIEDLATFIKWLADYMQTDI